MLTLLLWSPFTMINILALNTKLLKVDLDIHLTGILMYPILLFMANNSFDDRLISFYDSVNITS